MYEFVQAVYLPQEDLKERYRQPRTDRIKTYCRSIKHIGSATNLQITVEEKPNGTIHITVTAHPLSPHSEFEKAVQYIVGEFIKVRDSWQVASVCLLALFNILWRNVTSDYTRVALPLPIAC